MNFTIITHEKNNIMYTIAYRSLPVFEMGISVPNFTYYIQYVSESHQDIFDTSRRIPKKISLSGTVLQPSVFEELQILLVLSLIENSA